MTASGSLPRTLLTVASRGNLDATLAWVDESVAGLPTMARDRTERERRADLALAHELSKHATARNAALIAALRDRSGWPWPDTPHDEILRSAGSLGVPLARVVARVESWPTRPAELLAALRQRVAAAASNASALSPVEPAHSPGARRMRLVVQP